MDFLNSPLRDDMREAADKAAEDYLASDNVMPLRKDAAGEPRATVALDQYVAKLPSAQNAFDIFEGSWTSSVPLGFKAGGVGLHDDSRVLEFERRVGGFGGLDILELGPLEGMHTMMMHARGAASITAVEANKMAYLRCLIVKEVYNLTRAKFLLGDFCALTEQQPKRYDYISASGVLYHMTNPVKTAYYLAKRTDHIGIWTHYYDPSIMDRDHMKRRFSPNEVTVEHAGISAQGHIHSYSELLDWSGFCGGSSDHAVWISLEAWSALFDRLGFDLEIINQNVAHPNGPELLAFARKRQ